MYRGYFSAPSRLGLELLGLLVEHNVASVGHKLVICQAALQRLNQVQRQGALTLDRLPVTTKDSGMHNRSSAERWAVKN
jgi:hypothetical protein